MDLLPADDGFYNFRGLLAYPACNEGVLWFVMKIPLKCRKIAEYRKHYLNTAAPSADGRETDHRE